MNASFASKIGRFLAYFQSFADDILDFGFRKMKKHGKIKQKDDTSTVGGKVKFGVKKTASFIGDIGSSFYEKYEEIKADKKKRK